MPQCGPDNAKGQWTRRRLSTAVFWPDMQNMTFPVYMCVCLSLSLLLSLSLSLSLCVCLCMYAGVTILYHIQYVQTTTNPSSRVRVCVRVRVVQSMCLSETEYVCEYVCESEAEYVCEYV